MVEFKTEYATPMDRDYFAESPEVSPAANLEEPIIPIDQIGQTVTEGARFGNLIQTSTAAIRAGAGSIELATVMGGSGEGGADAYGKDAREAIREAARANEVVLTSIHTPTNVGNMSGFNPQQGNFNDEHRKVELEEVKRAIRFAADTAQGGAVVVHTGEFHRTMFDSPWNKEGKWKDQFVSYEEEPERAIKPLVDVRTGRVISEVRMNQLVPRAVWNRHEGRDSYRDENGILVNPGDYIDHEKRKVDRAHRVPKFDEEKNTFLVHRQTWKDFVKEAEEMNIDKAKEKGISLAEFQKIYPDEYVLPEEAFLYATTETQEAISRGWAGNYAERLRESFENIEKAKKSLKYYEELESKYPEEEKWKLEREMAASRHQDPWGILPTKTQRPVEYLKELIRDLRSDIEHRKEMVTGQLQSAEEQAILRDNAVAAGKYAKKKSMQSYAECGVNAMMESQNNPHAKRDIFVAPENLWPEFGWGTHPDELIELVQGARKEMANQLVKQWGYAPEQAKKEAEDHLKATFDTQHLGMWLKHFKGKPEESEDQRRDRFNTWYMEQVEKLAKSNVIGYVHLVDSSGSGHHHLPAGQGIFPVVDAVKLLRKHGFKGYVNSEGWEEEKFGQGRILVETWRAFGSPIQRMYGPHTPGPQLWTDVHHGYFGKNYPPNFIFGAYAPSNDWTLWSQVPME